MLTLIEVIAVIFMGLSLGSFATLLAHRLPFGGRVFLGARDKGEGIFARSACPKCRHALGFLDLVPFFSWLFLRGRCRHCKAAVSFCYPAIELATAMIGLLIYFRFGLTAEFFIMLATAPLLVSMVDIDFRHKIIPDAINLSLAVVGLLSLMVRWGVLGEDFPDVLGDGFLGACLYGFFAYGLRFIFMKTSKREALGLGDVKFFAVAGLWLGARLDIFALFLLLSGFLGVVLALFWRKVTGDREFPFGPALAGAFFISTLYGNIILYPLL